MPSKPQTVVVAGAGGFIGGHLVDFFRGLGVKHIKVFAEPGRFGGWPANHGIWSWGDEILVGFSAGYFKDNGPGRHTIDHDRPEEHLLARSRDGGETWIIENPAARGDLIPSGTALHGIQPPGVNIIVPVA